MKRRVTESVFLAAAVGAAVGLGCAPRTRFDPSTGREDGGLRLLDVRHVAQSAEASCGPAALAMVLGYWGVEADAAAMTREVASGAKLEVTAGELRELARTRGLESRLVSMSVGGLLRSVGLGRPVIVARMVEGGGHFEVLVGYHEARRYLVIDDPAGGLYRVGLEDFMRAWSAPGVGRLAVIVAPVEKRAAGRAEP